jgi:hypothetical protein
MEEEMKYTSQQYEKAQKFYEFYIGIPVTRQWVSDSWVRWYLQTPIIGTKSEKEAFRKTEEFFKEKELKTENPSSYTFVSTDKDVDLIRVVEEAPEGANFILVESRDRNNNVLKKSWVLVSRSALQNPRLQNGTLHNQAVSPSWGITFTKGWRISFVTQNYVQAVRENIEALLRVLNPKNTKTTVTVW